MSNLNTPQYPPYYPPPGPPAPPPRRRKKGRILVPALAAGAATIVGAILFGGRGTDPAPVRLPETGLVKPATLSALDLAEGDCYNAGQLPPTDGSSVPISTVEAVPCAQPHTAQVVARLGYPVENYTEVIDTKSVTSCTVFFESDLLPAVLDDERYTRGRIYPDAASWTRNPTVVCIVATEEPTTGTALS